LCLVYPFTFPILEIETEILKTYIVDLKKSIIIVELPYGTWGMRESKRK
jgi:hypothetical protein